MKHFLITDFNSQVLENISSNFKDEQVSTKYVSEQLPFDFQTIKYLSKKKKFKLSPGMFKPFGFTIENGEKTCINKNSNIKKKKSIQSIAVKK